MTIKDKIIIWIYNKNNQIENDTEMLNAQVRYRPMDSLDHYEVMRKKIEISVWKNFLDELFNIIVRCK